MCGFKYAGSDLGCYFDHFHAVPSMDMSYCLQMFIVQRESETADSEKGAIKAVQDLYDVVRYDVLSVNMRLPTLQCTFIILNKVVFALFLSSVAFMFRENYDTWNILARARAEGRLFSKLKWPRDADLVKLLPFDIVVLPSFLIALCFSCQN